MQRTYTVNGPVAFGVFGLFIFSSAVGMVKIIKWLW